MYRRRRPPSIKFYEDASLASSLFGTPKLTKFIRWCSFGLIKSDGQAGFIIVLIVLCCLAATAYVVDKSKTIPPTTSFELLPQESVGSKTGLPPIVAKPQSQHE